MTQKRRRVYEVVERREYPYFEVGDKVKMSPEYRSYQPVVEDGVVRWAADHSIGFRFSGAQPVVEDGVVRWAGSGAALDRFTVAKYAKATAVNDWAGIRVEEIPDSAFDAEQFMPADWTDEEWKASKANPLIVNRPIVPEINVEFKNGNGTMVLEKLLSELAALHQQEIEFFTRLKEREAELESITRTQVASQPDKG